MIPKGAKGPPHLLWDGWNPIWVSGAGLLALPQASCLIHTLAGAADQERKAVLTQANVCLFWALTLGLFHWTPWSPWVPPSLQSGCQRRRSPPGWPSLDVAQLCPDPKKFPLPLFFYINFVLISPAEPWERTTGLFHVLPTAEALLQAPTLWGQSSRSSGAVVQRA